MSNPAVWKVKVTSLSNGRRDTDDVIFPVQCWNEKKGRFPIQLKREVSIRPLGGSSLPPCGYFSSLSRGWRSPGLCRTQVRWSLLQLQDAHPRFKPLKFGCHLASEEDLPLVPSKDIQGQSLFLPVQLYDWNIFRNLYLRELVRFPSTNSSEDKAQLQEIL